jgi:hypothetical protein
MPLTRFVASSAFNATSFWVTVKTILPDCELALSTSKHMDSPLHVLVNQLILAFPDTYPSISLSEKEFAFRAGQVDICRRLNTALKGFSPLDIPTSPYPHDHV